MPQLAGQSPFQRVAGTCRLGSYDLCMRWSQALRLSGDIHMILKPRKRFFIHSGIQGALVVRLMVQWSLFVIMTCAVSVTLQVMLDPLAPNEVRLQQLRISVGSFILVSLCLVPVFVRDAIHFSHRFVGPILRLQSEMRKVDVVAELRPFQLREKDYWQEMAEDYNDFVGRLKEAERKAEFERSAAVLADKLTTHDAPTEEHAS